MARENQLLQIALIIFVMICVLLGVALFLNVRKYEETLVQLKEQKKVATESQDKTNKVNDGIGILKNCIGAKDTDTVAEVKEQFEKDMKTWAATFPEKNRYYRTALEHMFNVVVKSTNASLADANAQLAAFQEKYKGREATRDPEIVQHKKAAETAAADLAKEREKFNSERNRIAKDEADVASNAKTNQVTDEKERKDLLGEKQKLVAEVGRMRVDVGTKGKLLNDHEKMVPDRASLAGQIVSSQQATHTVMINLGSADSLNRLTTFSVYSGDEANLDKATPKASIEVAEILDAHLSLARVLKDESIDPILAGDKIWTPGWSPGQKMHFALAGKMDIDNDNRDHMSDLRLRLTASGAVVDAWLSKQDAHTHGKLEISTNFLVMGSPPDEHDSADYRAAWTNLLAQAERLGTEKIPVKNFVKKIGAENSQFRAIRFGPGANESDFRPPTSPTGSRPSGNSVSPIFQPRQPPKAPGNSAY